MRPVLRGIRTGSAMHVPDRSRGQKKTFPEEVHVERQLE